MQTQNLAALTFASLLIALQTVLPTSVCAQARNNLPHPTSAFCNRDNSLELIEQQLESALTISDLPQRVRLIIKAADLLWLYRNNQARKAFSDAFDFAQQDFKEYGPTSIKLGVGLRMDRTDLRYLVITNLAKRDPAWAKKLTHQLLKEREQETQESTTNDQRPDWTARNLLATSFSLLATDQPTAIEFARLSFAYPAVLDFPMFLYKLSAVNKAAADQLYREALAAYADAPMNRFLFLSGYPFGNSRDAGETVGYTFYQVPAGYSPNLELQRRFVETLLHRASSFLADPKESAPSQRVSEPGQMLMALTLLSGQINRHLPELIAPTEETKRALSTALLPSQERVVNQLVRYRNFPTVSFQQLLDSAEKQPNVDVRDHGLAMAVMGSRDVENLDEVLRAVDRISDASLRPSLLDFVFFERTLRAIKEQRFIEARKLASRVGQLDQRAYLYSRIAEASLKDESDQTEAREMLEEVVAAALKAESGMVNVRTLLAAAYLYSKIDVNRSVGVLSEAVKQINQLEHPDFTLQHVTRKIEGKKFSSYANFSTPGFTPENAFQEIARIDFDGMMSQASLIANKPLRVSTTFALLEPCLQRSDRPTKPKRLQ